ncbi:NAD(P)/FAD-dependent oxidoreductase [Bdellovibrio svalbardensis]|uniref:FAD-dependent oxidoreductase n=1 Tax=Bdellovibrio svalbardensis TaxID=2972972 RepID=A0ABT6DN45_9BACT|nr:FAD-dependent oxidoreductase [Bdellovibrio svalbardensis]MDG0818203.1 FAD-dependent oxidoreductase [Bdellovibrio svalbardensis]
MSKIFNNIEIPIDQDLEEKLQYLMPEHGPYRILRQSVDARRAHSPHFVYSVEVAAKGETLSNPQFDLEKIKTPSEKPLIVGTGPAGLFAALRFVERGVPCVLFERGSDSGERMKGINQFWRYGKLDTRNNVCFGEGGAGLYSDGKLITRIKSPHIPYVMNRLVKFGAPEEIQWLSNPHVGSDRIRRVIPKLREFLKANGCEIHFNTQVTEILTEGKQVVGVRTEHGTEFKSPHVILATGHSAEDMINHLHELGVHLDGKSFAMGLRIEHSQADINKIQYRQFSEHPKLGAANYKLADHDDETGIGVYSFCMCPGGYVLSAGTEADGLVCNGMSNYNRNSPYANAAIVVSIDHNKLFGNDTFGGMKLRRELETNAFKAVQSAGGTRELPAQNLMDFLGGTSKKGPRALRPGSSPSGALNIRLDELLPKHMTTRIREGLEKFNRNMKGFVVEDAQVYGIESRTSCPVRVTRDNETLESISHPGLYPAGEGAGYAGGITSAACDGIKIAEKIIAKLS